MAKKPEPDWTETPINYLNLTKRASNVLRRSRIETVGKLASLSDESLCWLPGMGPGSLRECRAAVRQFLTERGDMGDVAVAMRRAINEAGVSITPAETIGALNALANEGWSISRL